MTNPLVVTLVQFDIQWHRPKENRDKIDSLLVDAYQAKADKNHPGNSDLIVLPEMFNTGFTMSPRDMAEPMDGPTIQWMRQCARRYGAVVTGTIAVNIENAFYNRLLWIHPNGEIEHYDKRHLFRMADEHSSYTAGTSRPVFSAKGWRIRPIVCYDLRFPVWCRVRNNDYDALLCPANWPDPRHNAWLGLLTARAIENQAFVIANNRTGRDANGKNYLGNSGIIDPKGRTVCDAGTAENVVTLSLSLDEVQRFRERFPIHADADDFELLEDD